jgi:hypothetical protein
MFDRKEPSTAKPQLKQQALFHHGGTGREKKSVHASRACYVDVKLTTHETSFFLSSS